MPKLDKEVTKQLRDIALKSALETVISDRVKSVGISDSKLPSNLAQEWLDGNFQDFEASVNGEIKQFSVEELFGDDEFSEITQQTDQFINDKAPNILDEVIKEEAKASLADFFDDWPLIKIDERAQNQAFQERLELRWGDTLDGLRQLILLSSELGEDYLGRLKRSKAKSGLVKRQAISLLHTRGLQVGHEIIVLLENGFANGAMARWRSLYEIGIIIGVIDQGGDELAERYFDHHVVEIRRAKEVEFLEMGLEYPPPNRNADIQELERVYASLLDKYGSEFKNEYGWASNHLNNKSPRFRQLEKTVGVQEIPLRFKTASFMVHAGPAGIFRGPSSMGKGHTLAGASNAGLDEAAINTAYSITSIDAPLIEKPHGLEKAAKMRAFINVRDKIERAAKDAANQLLADDQRIENEFKNE